MITLGPIAILIVVVLVLLVAVGRLGWSDALIIALVLLLIIWILGGRL